MRSLHAFLLAAVALSAVAAAYDARKGEIPNALTLGPLALALPVHALLEAPHGMKAAALALAASVGGAALCALVPLLLYWKGAIGGGDVKLLAALGALLGPSVGLEATTYAFVAAALVAPARMAWEGKLLATLGNTLALVVNPLLPAARRRPLAPEMLTWMRFGPSIFVGTLAAAVARWS